MPSVVIRDRKTGLYVSPGQGTRAAAAQPFTLNLDEAKHFDRAEVEWLESLGGFELIEVAA